MAQLYSSDDDEEDVGGRRFVLYDDKEEYKRQVERFNKLLIRDNTPYIIKADILTDLQRLLILGNENGIYTCGEPKELNEEQISCINRLIIAGRGREVVAWIQDIGWKRRACKQRPILYALARCARSEDPNTKTAAYEILPDVCRHPIQLFQFIEYCEKWSAGKGWGRAHKKALSRWYHSFDDNELKLARLVTRFPGRFRWCHKDIIRLAHIKPRNNKVGLILRYITHGLDKATEMYCSKTGQTNVDPGVVQIAEFLKGVEDTKTCTEPRQIIRYIQNYKLSREHLSLSLLAIPDVLHALLNNMSLETVMRNLRNMTLVGLLSPGSITEALVVSRLSNLEQVRASKLHPYYILTLKCRYHKCSSDRSELTWSWNDEVRKALDKAFHLSFCNLVPTGKRLFVTYDASGMYEPVSGNSSVIARDAAATMVMAAVRTETDPHIYSFSSSIKDMEVSKQETLSDVLSKFEKLYFSDTDCSRPITYALEHKILVDVFIIYTDINANCGDIQPLEALTRYRQLIGAPDTKLIIVGMSCNKPRYSFSFADHSDPFMLDIVGFDTYTPLAIDLFIRGKIL